MSEHTSGRLYIRTNRHPNTDGTAWGWVDLYPPGSMNQASPEGVQITWSIGRKSEANARRLVACWNACEGISTEALEMLLVGSESLPHTIEVIRDQRSDLLEAAMELKDVCNRPSSARTRSYAWKKLDKAIAKARAGIKKARG